MSKTTITDIYAAGPEELPRAFGGRLVVVEDDRAISLRFAEEMAAQIGRNNRTGRPTSLILPVGPRGGYPVFVEAAKRNSLDLSRTTFFFMDEYVDEEDAYIPSDHPLSFRGFVRESLIEPLAGQAGFDPDRVRFPDPKDPDRYGRLIREAGGIDLVLAGVGIDGHVAFNEPEPSLSAEAYANLTARVVELTAETRTVNAAMEAGGAIELIPRRAVTVGMAEILSARRVVVFMNRSWQKAVIRRLAFGEPTAAFPVSIVRGHGDFTAVVTAEVTGRPMT